jgi:hypothetical protein
MSNPCCSEKKNAIRSLTENSSCENVGILIKFGSLGTVYSTFYHVFTSLLCRNSYNNIIIFCFRILTICCGIVYGNCYHVFTLCYAVTVIIILLYSVSYVCKDEHCVEKLTVF